MIVEARKRFSTSASSWLHLQAQQANCYNPCGYYNNTFAVYYSKDLGQDSWQLGQASLIPAMDDPTSPLSSQAVVYFSPFVVFCRLTGT